ncbi:MAG: MATE family efflux transporter, partial [Chitinophagaceae bacterium]
MIFIALGAVIFRHPIFQTYVAKRHSQWHLNKATWRRLLAIGIPSSLQIGMEAGAFALSGIIIGTISVVAQAAHQIALSCASFTFMVSLGLAQACSIRTSNALGNADWPRIKKIGSSTLLVALIYGVLCAVGFALLKNWLPLFFTSNAEVLRLAGVLLLFAAIFQISDSTQAIGAGLLRGIKDVNLPTILIAIAYWVVGLPVGYFFATRYNLGAPGLWLGLILGLTLSSVFLVIRFRGRVVRQLAGLATN